MEVLSRFVLTKKVVSLQSIVQVAPIAPIAPIAPAQPIQSEVKVAPVKPDNNQPAPSTQAEVKAAPTQSVQLAAAHAAVSEVKAAPANLAGQKKTLVLAYTRFTLYPIELLIAAIHKSLQKESKWSNVETVMTDKAWDRSFKPRVDTEYALICFLNPEELRGDANLNEYINARVPGMP